MGKDKDIGRMKKERTVYLISAVLVGFTTLMKAIGVFGIGSIPTWVSLILFFALASLTINRHLYIIKNVSKEI